MRSLAELLADPAWRPIPGCPGRYVLRPPRPGETPEQLAGGGAATAHRAAAARDEVLVLPLPGGGGLLSYRHGDGAHVHTLCDAAGLARKLAQLGLPSPG